MLLNIIFILIILFIILLIVFKLGSYFKKDATYGVVDNISEYNYTLDNRDTKLMSKEFNNLKNILKQDEINYEEYAKSISKLFIIDLFTINNKENKYDVGSLEYVYPKVVDNFKLHVEDTLYKYITEDNKEKYPIVKEIVGSNIEDTTYTYEKKEYPEVKKITGNTVSDTTYTYQKEDFEAYKVIVTWDYSKDLGYYTKGELILIKEDNKLYVVQFKGVEEN